MLPRMAWALGDPAGVGPELVAKGLVDRELMALCRPVVVGPAWLLARGARVAGVQLTTAVTPPGRIDAVPCDVIPVVDDGWPEQPFPPGVLSGEGGKLSMEMLRVAFDLTKKGVTAAVVYGPLNKEAMSKGGSPYKDELRLFGDWLGDTDRGEINAAAGLFTTRVTSHVPLKEVPGLIQPDRILKAIRLLHKTLVAAGIASPRIGVAALNPHGGEHGLCGDEEVRVIAPTVARAREQGMPAQGPFPADTIFVRARKGEFDGVVIMYHDQGQVATKLLGFDQGVTISGGLSFPVLTPAHGTAYDIAGKGLANLGAFKEAARLGARMAAQRT